VFPGGTIARPAGAPPLVLRPSARLSSCPRMPQSSASLPVIASPTTPSTAAVCPYLLAADGRWRSATPAREHRCTAGTPATIVALEKQRRLCLAPAHTGCATFTAATARRAEDDERPSRALRPARALPRTAPLILDHGRTPVHLGPMRERGLAQAALLLLMGAAFAAIVVARLSGSPIEGGVLAGAGGPGATATQGVSGSATASPAASDRGAGTAAPTTAPGAAEPTPDAETTPSPDGASSAPTASGATTYTVRAGDTLSGIAAEFGTTVAALVERNGIKDPSRIAIGQELELPPVE
jgi:LysM repeat protein